MIKPEELKKPFAKRMKTLVQKDKAPVDMRSSLMSGKRKLRASGSDETLKKRKKSLSKADSFGS